MTLVLLVTALAIAAATVWVPWVSVGRSWWVLSEPVPAPPTAGSATFDSYGPIWRDRVRRLPAPVLGGVGSVEVEHLAIQWPRVLLTQVLIVIISGGLLTWLVRRERPRRAAP